MSATIYKYMYVGGNSSDGIIMGYDTSAKVSYFGAAPVAQQAHVADVTTTAQAVSAINNILLYLERFGLVATA